MNLTEHFTYAEMTFSEAAARLGLSNDPDGEQLVNLTTTTVFMERVRTLLGSNPIQVHSGFRSAAVNALVGGVSTSAHCYGRACDFTCSAFGNPLTVARAIQNSALLYDQLILEYGWVHVGLPAAGVTARLQKLTKHSALSPYEIGINV